MNKFYHVGCNFAGLPKTADVDGTLNKTIGADWLRYTQNCWIIWTAKNPGEILNVFAPHISLADSVFIAAMDMTDRHGYLPPWCWQWIDSKMGRVPPPDLGSLLLAYKPPPPVSR